MPLYRVHFMMHGTIRVSAENMEQAINGVRQATPGLNGVQLEKVIMDVTGIDPIIDVELQPDNVAQINEGA